MGAVEETGPKKLGGKSRPQMKTPEVYPDANGQSEAQMEYNAHSYEAKE